MKRLARVFSRRRAGFTLAELLVVAAVVALLAAVLVPRMASYSERARQARAAEDIHTLRTIVEAYAADEGQGRYPVNSNDLSVSDSIAAVMQRHGIRWTGDETGITDPWGRPYYYAQVVPE